MSEHVVQVNGLWRQDAYADVEALCICGWKQRYDECVGFVRLSADVFEHLSRRTLTTRSGSLS